MEDAPTRSRTPGRTRRRLGLPVPALVGLALLAAPRVVLHDLGVLTPGSAVTTVLALGPPACWVAVVLLTRAVRPVATLLVVGALSGVVLAAIHQVLWHVVWPDGGPTLGGNLRDLPGWVGELLARGAAVVSGVATGLLVGAVAAAAAWLVLRVAGRRLS